MKKFPHNLVEKLMDTEQLCRQLKSGDIKGETGKWQLSTKRLVQTISRIQNFLRKKLTVNVGYLNNIKKY
jgi:hypothetical protein